MPAAVDAPSSEARSSVKASGSSLGNAPGNSVELGRTAAREPEPTEPAIEAALVRATLDGRVAIADELARQLRLRRESSAGSVVSLRRERARLP
jgi:hypothetical protein